MNCVKCRGAMHQESVALDVGNLWSGSKIDAVDIEVCPACGGAWFDGGEFSKFLKKRIHGLAPNPALDRSKKDSFDSSVGECPRCKSHLDKRPSRGIMIDSCAKCGGLWLDGGEFPTDPRGQWGDRLKNVLKRLG